MAVRRLPWVAVLVALSAPAAAQTVPMTERPIVLPEGQGELSVDVLLGLNAGAAGKTVALATGLASDRYSGVSVAYGVAKNLEIGGAFAFAYSRDPEYGVARRRVGWPPFIGSGSDTQVGPIAVWARYRLHPVVAIEAGLLFPGEKFQNNRLAFRVGLPFKAVLSPGLFSLHVRPDLMLGFAKSDYAGGKTVQVSFYVDAGATLTLIPELFLDLSLGYGRSIDPTPAQLKLPGSGYLPLTFQVGYTVIPQVDLALAFSLANLTPPSGSGAADARNMTLTVNYRF